MATREEREDRNPDEQPDNLTAADIALVYILRGFSQMMQIASERRTREPKAIEIYNSSLSDGLKETRKDRLLQSIRRRGSAVKTKLSRRP